MSSVAARFVHTSINKDRSPINCVLVSFLALLSLNSSLSLFFSPFLPSFLPSFFFLFFFPLQFTPDGRRLITGSTNGEFTLWSSIYFNFETILQAHNSAVRCMVWSHNGNYLVSGDNSGTIKYWQSNMSELNRIQAHKETVRALASLSIYFSPLAYPSHLSFSCHL